MWHIFQCGRHNQLPPELAREMEKVKTPNQLKEFVKKVIEEAKNNEGELGLKRLHGHRKAFHELDELATKFAEFVDRFSPVVEVAAGVGGPYGSAAYKSLAVLMAVALSLINGIAPMLTCFLGLRQQIQN